MGQGPVAGDNKLADLIGATQDELKKRQGEAPERVLLYLDQGEELYTLHDTKQATARYKTRRGDFPKFLPKG